MYRLTLVTLLAATSASAIQNVERAGDCSSGNLWQGKYCCPSTFIYQQDNMDEPICCAGDSADGYYFNSGPSSCTAGTSTPITAFDRSGNAVSGGASATGSFIMTSSTTLASVTAETTLSSASAGTSGNVGSSASASVALTSSISSAASAAQTSSPASTTSSDGAASMITSGPLGLAIGALGALVLL